MIALNQLITHVLYGSNNWKLHLVTNWRYIVGPLSSRICIEKIERDTLVIGVCDSAWLQELYLLSTILLQKINQALPAPHIKKLIFKQIGNRALNRQTQNPKKNPKQLQRPLTAQERKALQAINDQELSSALYNFLLRCQQTTAH